MPLFRVLATLKSEDNVPRNHSTNSWHFNIEADTPGGDTQAERWEEVADALETFYESALGPLRGDLMAAGGHELQAYDLTEPEPRLPKYMRTFSMTGNPTGSLPAEVAVVCSFEGPRVAGVPQARRRNRIYLGPLSNQVLDVSTGLVGLGFGTGARDAMNALAVTSAGDNGWRWDIYSPTDDFNGVISNGWVNNEFDTQRRRGRSGTIRWTFTQNSD